MQRSGVDFNLPPIMHGASHNSKCNTQPGPKSNKYWNEAESVRLQSQLLPWQQSQWQQTQSQKSSRICSRGGRRSRCRRSKRRSSSHSSSRSSRRSRSRSISRSRCRGSISSYLVSKPSGLTNFKSYFLMVFLVKNVF